MSDRFKDKVVELLEIVSTYVMYGELYDHCQDVIKAATKEAGEIDRLEAIVAKLTKTEDGVVVVPGMIVFTKPAKILLRCNVDAVGIQDGQPYLCLSETPTDGSFVGGRFRFCKYPNECYAALEAAEAAYE